HTKTRLNLHWQQALIIGFGQALAIIPGVSRSGATISAGRLLGLEREEATKFSFMLSAPIIFGAVMSYIANQRFGIFDANSIVGLTVSFVTAMVAIKWILGYLKTADFTLFIWYRFILAGIIVIIYILKNNYLV
ncbi:UDP-diphosphatase, partial [Candidatus Berkelbacteria bacterium CG_4_8_14_3_um_filter_33_6]